jgi:serine-type D-Ala-D-Ala carboxypeptidase/endopeptidase (penicillin-binding protein 4)
MRKIVLIGLMCLLQNCVFAQTVSQKLQAAFAHFEGDSQLKNAISSIFVTDAATGKTVFQKNFRVGLAPASTQKIVTAITALEMLGPDYRYSTRVQYDGSIVNGRLLGNIRIQGSGDPSLGSSRFDQTPDTIVLKKWVNAIKKAGIQKIDGNLVIDDTAFETQQFPDGWIWQDIGNYYGAGHYALNWQENQYEISLQSTGKMGSVVSIRSTDSMMAPHLLSEVKAASPGSGDNAYIYIPAGDDVGRIRGTIPVNQPGFKISGAHLYPPLKLSRAIREQLRISNIDFRGNVVFMSMNPSVKYDLPVVSISVHQSPSLDSIIYWLLQKSINLYGEAILKTLALTQKGFGANAAGVTTIQQFWKKKGLDERELNISDGSGLSPQNRITTHAQVEILAFAKKQGWFGSFYRSLPEYNGMKMKSGTIKDVKGFCGYHKSKGGKEYIFSFLVNNYSGSSSTLVGKMYKVLDVLK